MRNKWIASFMLALLLALTCGLPVLADDGSSMVLSDDFTLEAGEILAKDLVVFGGDVRLEEGSVVEGEVVVLGGAAWIAGHVGSDVAVFGGTVELAASAVIDGDLVVFGEIHRDPQAQVYGNTVEGLDATKYLRTVPKLLPQISVGQVRTGAAQARAGSWFAQAFETLGTIIGMVVAAFLLYALVPDQLGRMRQVMSGSWVLSLVVGVLTLVLLMVVSPILVIICIGIPVVLALILVAGVCVLAAWAIAGRILGARILGWMKAAPKAASVEAALGVAVLVLFAQLPVIGFLLSFLLIAWGLGAAVLSRLGTRAYPGSDPFSGTPQAAGPMVTSSASEPFESDIAVTHKRGDTKPLNTALLDGIDPDE